MRDKEINTHVGVYEHKINYVFYTIAVISMIRDRYYGSYIYEMCFSAIAEWHMLTVFFLWKKQVLELAYVLPFTF